MDELGGRVLALAQALIERPSVTPDDAGCLDLIGGRLAALGFSLERIDAGGTSNLWATLGNGSPVFGIARVMTPPTCWARAHQGSAAAAPSCAVSAR